MNINESNLYMKHLMLTLVAFSLIFIFESCGKNEVDPFLDSYEASIKKWETIAESGSYETLKMRDLDEMDRENTIYSDKESKMDMSREQAIRYFQLYDRYLKLNKLMLHKLTPPPYR